MTVFLQSEDIIQEHGIVMIPKDLVLVGLKDGKH